MLHTEIDEDVKILLVRISFMGDGDSFFEYIFSPSGVARRREREAFFANEVLHFLRHDTHAMVLGVNFNGVSRR